MENFVNTTDRFYTALNKELFELWWLSNTDYIWRHNQSTQAYMHFSEFVFYFAWRELARWKGYRTEAHQHGRNLQEWFLALANLVHPLQVTSQKSGAATQLQSPLPIVMMKLFLPWRSLCDLRGAVVACSCYVKTGFPLLNQRETGYSKHALGVFGLLRYLCR